MVFGEIRIPTSMAQSPKRMDAGMTIMESRLMEPLEWILEDLLGQRGLLAPYKGSEVLADFESPLLSYLRYRRIYLITIMRIFLVVVDMARFVVRAP